MDTTTEYTELLKEIYNDLSLSIKKTDCNESDLLVLKNKYNENNQKIKEIESMIMKWENSILDKDSIKVELATLSTNLKLYKMENEEIQKKINEIETSLNNNDRLFVNRFKNFLIDSNIIEGKKTEIVPITKNISSDFKFLKVENEKIPLYKEYFTKCYEGLNKKCSSEGNPSKRVPFSDCITYFLKKRNIKSISYLKGIIEPIGLNVNTIYEFTKSDTAKDRFNVTSKRSYPIFLALGDTTEDVIGLIMKYIVRVNDLTAEYRRESKDNFDYIFRRFFFDVIEKRVTLSGEITKFKDKNGYDFYLYSKRLYQFEEWLRTTPISSIMDFPFNDNNAKYDVFASAMTKH